MPCTAPLTRQRVRITRHGSSGLVRYTSADGPSTAILCNADGMTKNGFRAP